MEFQAGIEQERVVRRPRKANECFIDGKPSLPAEMLFDEFWRGGELALLFGPSGSGKSVLAVQVADALARGRPLDGFQMPRGRRRVLYVDLEHSDTQFGIRYSHSTPNMRSPKAYKFAENLYRDRPPPDDDIVDWVRAEVLENRFQVVVVDALSAIRRTHDGTRETLAMMRRLKPLRDELGISILVLTDSEPPRRSGRVGEYGLGRSRILCGVADSVFALAKDEDARDEWRLVHTRSRSASIFWDVETGPLGSVTRLAGGLLGFRFDGRFTPDMDDEKRRLIRRVRSMHVGGATYRAIADELGMSKTQAARLLKKWTPALESDLSEPGAIATGFRPDEEETGDEDWPDEDEDLPDDEDLHKEAYEGEFTDRYLVSGGHRPIWKEKWEANEAEPPASAGGTGPAPKIASDHEFDGKSSPTNEGGVAAASADGVVLSRKMKSGATLSPDKRRTIEDLKPSRDAYGHEIFIESKDEHTGQATVWYRRDRNGKLYRHVRKNGLGTVLVDPVDDESEVAINGP